MLVEILTALILGIIIGLLLTFLSFWILKIKCPKCKQLKPLREIITFRWKERVITGQSCQECQRPKSQVEMGYPPTI